MRTSDQIKAEIQEKFGFVPPFFSPAESTPQVLENLWQQTLSAYIDNPLPALFKEKLSAYLSRYCAIPYCMVCHSCTLRPLGMSAHEVLQLLESTPPTTAEINQYFPGVDTQQISIKNWAEPDTAIENYIFYCSILIFLEISDSEECQTKLRRLLTPDAYNYLVLFIGYVKTCHTWMLSHPEVSYEADRRVQDYLQGSLQEEPALNDFFANYKERVRLESENRAVRLAELAERQRGEAILRQSEERYRSLVAATSQIVWLSNAAGEFIKDVAGWSALTGRSEAALAGWGWLEDIHPDEQEETKEKWKNAIATHSRFESEFRLNTSNHNYRYFSARGIAVKETNGSIREWVGTCTDITQRKLAEENQQKLVSIIENSSDFIGLATLDGQPLYLNEAARQMVGLESEEQVRQTKITDYLNPEDLPYVQEHILPTVFQQGRWEGEFQFRHFKTNQLIPVYYNLFTTKDKQTGKILGLATVTRNITDKKLAELALKKAYDDLESLVQQRTAQLSTANQLLKAEIAERQKAEATLEKEQEFLKVILDNVQAGIVACNANGILTLFNQATSEFHGLPKTPIPANQWAEYYDLYQPDGKTRMKTEEIPLFRALRGEIVHNVEMMIVPKTNNNPSGIARILLASGRAIIDTNGNKQGAVVVMHDITERKQAEAQRVQLISEQAARKEAEAARNELQRIFKQTPAAIQITYGSNHILQTVNSLYIKLIGKRDLIGKTIREAFPEVEGQGYFELLDQVYATGQPFVGKEMCVEFDRNDDGIVEESFWNFVYQPLFDSNNQVYAIMTHAVEATEQVRARQEIEKKAEELTELTEALKRSNQELDRFAYVTSHDLKAPLRGIASIADWIEEDLAECLTEESRSHINLLRGRVYRLEALIDGILQYSRAGRVQLIGTVNVADLLSETIELLAPPPEVTVIIDPGMPTLKTERIPLQQVFMNLINNAIKHGNKSDICINISVKKQRKFYKFSVSDNGVGIEPQYHQKIWEIFQRLEARDKVEGTGIGLAVIKKIIESRGGQVFIESELGCGATFSFTWQINYSQPRHT
ncbi:PAS/PAC sensor signal transduction histidine kinase [Crinalium epipsammum PCC 9333]|uniref:histidine kinase n=1 Tax=Crinalium epipsammum PCC 9333 TaxID=1173022 RepID=K9VVS1_9CYAN|nr:PAS domain S-box protein [Crinalium epipsammum]AFZ12051.1 PAS/PAC sensor signal transduction histidine kinase [Crinalium epipsammum PCC 9333]